MLSQRTVHTGQASLTDTDELLPLNHGWGFPSATSVRIVEQFPLLSENHRGCSGKETSLLAILREIHESLPSDVWETVPRDLSVNLDYYIYGAAKQEE